ncbi:proteasome subunit alpha [Naumannella halotolerans]|uniref:Proteasome subunit alpha n=1 Tax=Naumannella halotolerans TaxID=993414 RepID=A0A4V3ENE1_9ACTN|nr:proteasome subunit alpha [Naumannella halotolerans]TDT33438.1 proteasome alpha subunit [Naumannella halotolerans]
MSMPMYVAPEQLMKDRADFARKGIARGRSVAVSRYADGIVFVAENRSTLHKISEVYDRIGFAAVGRYNEFEQLRVLGIRQADLRGYSYDRADVTGIGLANMYAQLLGSIFSSGGDKPYEVELAVAEVGDSPGADVIYRLSYDGSVTDEPTFAIMGGSAESVSKAIIPDWRPDLPLATAVKLLVKGLTPPADPAADTPAPVLAPEALEAAVLDRTRASHRKFRRLTAPVLAELLGSSS